MLGKKRGQNEGSIFQRKDGRWVAEVSLGWMNGTRKRKLLYGKTRKEAHEKLTTALRDQQRGLPIVGERQSLREFLGRWLEDSVRPTVRPRTMESYAEICRLHVIPALGHLPLVKITPQHIQSLLNEKLESGLSPRRVQYIHAVIRRALGLAEKFSFVPRNVARLVDPPSVPQIEIVPFNAEESKKFLVAVEGDRLEALFVVAVGVGLRKGEVLGLYWNDIDLERSQLRVRRSLQRLSGQLQLVPPKTDKSRRVLGLPAFVVQALHQHRSRQLEERLRAGGSWQESDLVFTTPTGTPLDGPGVTRRLHRILDSNELRRVRFHDLRHTSASLLFFKGVDRRTIMENLGHSQISLTSNVYTHVVPELQREAARKMDDLLGTY